MVLALLNADDGVGRIALRRTIFFFLDINKRVFDLRPFFAALNIRPTTITRVSGRRFK